MQKKTSWVKIVGNVVLAFVFIMFLPAILEIVLDIVAVTAGGILNFIHRMPPGGVDFATEQIFTLWPGGEIVLAAIKNQPLDTAATPIEILFVGIGACVKAALPSFNPKKGDHWTVWRVVWSTLVNFAILAAAGLAVGAVKLAGQGMFQHVLARHRVVAIMVGSLTLAGMAAIVIVIGAVLTHSKSRNKGWLRSLFSFLMAVGQWALGSFAILTLSYSHNLGLAFGQTISIGEIAGSVALIVCVALTVLLEWLDHDKTLF